MAEKKRQCGTCRFFDESESGGHGKCTHPLRDTALREMVLLRPNELGCRTRWGTSLWQDPNDESEPKAPDVPQQPALPEPIAAQMHYDDEVTSVSIAGSTSTRPSFDDDVVDSGAVSPGLGSWNDTLQEERRRLLRYSERDALAGARKRHIEKQSRQRELVPFAEDAAGDAEDEAPETPVQNDLNTTGAPVRSTFPPDDYVEEERSSDTDSPAQEDALVDDGVQPGGNRSPRSRRLMREPKSPKGHKAMGFSMPAEMSVTSNNPEHREQWNEVPKITPGVELPFVNAPTPGFRSSSPLRVSASMAPITSAPAPNRLVSQARELKTEDRLRHERALRHVDVPLADEQTRQHSERPAHAATQRPLLNQAPAPQAAPVERLKTSPLRGYHPAVKGTVTRHHETQEHHPTQQGVPTVSVPVQADEPQAQAPRAQARPEATPPQVSPGRVPERREPTPARHEQPRSREPQRRPLVPVKESTPFERAPIAIAPDVPRTCGTCTSFRPSDVKGRGSCANAFAGPVQRVVHANDLACQHTYGSFWIPADDKVWLDTLETFADATPRVDRMIARRKQRSIPVLPDLEELTS